MGDVLGDMAGESSRLASLVATMENGAVVLVLTVFLGAAGWAACPLGGFEALDVGGVVDSLSSSGMVGQYVLSTCLSAGRRIGFDRKKSMPDSRHCCKVVRVDQRNLREDVP
jgi:hypothetical protein